MSNKVRAFVVIVVVCSIGGFAALVAAGDPNALRSAEAALCFACLGIFAQFLAYSLDSTRTATMVVIPFLATIFLAPTWVALVTIGGVAIAGNIIAKRKRSTLQNVFNVAQWTVSGIAAITTYRLLGGPAWLV